MSTIENTKAQGNRNKTKACFTLQEIEFPDFIHHGK